MVEGRSEAEAAGVAGPSAYVRLEADLAAPSPLGSADASGSEDAAPSLGACVTLPCHRRCLAAPATDAAPRRVYIAMDVLVREAQALRPPGAWEEPVSPPVLAEALARLLDRAPPP